MLDFHFLQTKMPSNSTSGFFFGPRVMQQCDVQFPNTETYPEVFMPLIPVFKKMMIREPNLYSLHPFNLLRLTQNMICFDKYSLYTLNMNKCCCWQSYRNVILTGLINSDVEDSVSLLIFPLLCPLLTEYRNSKLQYQTCPIFHCSSVSFDFMCSEFSYCVQLPLTCQIVFDILQIDWPLYFHAVHFFQ